MQKLVISRNHETGFWQVANGSIVVPTGHRNAEKAGDVASAVARANRDSQIGIKAVEIGTQTILAFGDVVWLRPDFGG